MPTQHDPFTDPDPKTGRVGEPGQADRAAEVQTMLDRAADPADEYDASDDMARAIHETGSAE